MPPEVIGAVSHPREVLQEFTMVLSAEDTFAGMSWHDAKHAATAIICDAISREDAASFCCAAPIERSMPATT
ncbi:hypothetical protein DQP55_08880 [Mycolicibacterium sp. GF69]|uniref:hypothetical protein n=1 Tax=Mycolicibacterium sp. GF69 TaxID=2267251 RepID=UPI000DCE7E2D|nr:hypothetical protein [Mycolicibacterium sp. GF69]RAV14663.1 hypothetical protein DQP55_08880 [Mycolicibacterium sp. GF69]